MPQPIQLKDHERDARVVRNMLLLTKADKLKANEKNRNRAQLNKLFPSDRPALAYSSLKRDGFGPLAKNLFERGLAVSR